MWLLWTVACAVDPGGDEPGEDPRDPAGPLGQPLTEEPPASPTDAEAPEALDWDPAPPAPMIGEQRLLTASCALLEGELQATVVYTGGGRWDSTGTPSGAARPDLAPCFATPVLWLEWSHEPSVYLHANGWAHTLEPTSTEGRWLGQASPLEPSLACLDALEAAGLDWPVTMSVHLGPPL